jgi:hypothetical protein
MAKRFIEVPAADLLTELRLISEAVRAKGGKVRENVHGKEIVFDITPPDCLALVRVYTSLASGQDSVRDCGEDAVRLIIGAIPVELETRARAFGDEPPRFKPLGKSTRIYRTAPQGPTPERVAIFLGRLRDAIRENYRIALHTPTCPTCKAAPMAMREGPRGPFYGCTRFPNCRGTRPSNLS